MNPIQQHGRGWFLSDDKVLLNQLRDEGVKAGFKDQTYGSTNPVRSLFVSIEGKTLFLSDARRSDITERYRHPLDERGIRYVREVFGADNFEEFYYKCKDEAELKSLIALLKANNIPISTGVGHPNYTILGIDSRTSRLNAWRKNVNTGSFVTLSEFIRRLQDMRLKPPFERLAGYDVNFTDDGMEVKVGCTIVTFRAVEQIYTHMKLLQHRHNK